MSHIEPEKVFENKKDSRWVNKQRTLIVSSRGITQRHRHFMLDLFNMMPHSKKEVKIEKKNVANQISELCYIHSCANFMYFEARKRTDLYLWIGRFPDGPTVKFLVENIHTSEEMKLTGNCLKGSRPILSFDNNFKENINLKLMRELFVHGFNVPRYHPKCKPSVDHMFAFAYTDKRIWFRNYQIATEDLGKDIEDHQLIEIGPRFVLNPIVILDGCMMGNLLYKNPDYKTRTKLRIEKKQQRRDEMMKKEMRKTKAEEYKNLEVENDEVDHLLDNDDQLNTEFDEFGEPIKNKKQQKQQNNQENEDEEEDSLEMEEGEEYDDDEEFDDDEGEEGEEGEFEEEEEEEEEDEE